MGAKHNLSGMFNAIERTSYLAIQSLIDLHLFRRLSRALRGLIDDSSMIRPEPWELVRAVAACARRTAVAWSSDDFGYPTAFTISVSREAWECFYRHDTDKIARRIASDVGQRLAQPFLPDQSPSVSIECDLILNRGDFDIVASFDHRMIPDEEPVARGTVVRGAAANVSATASESVGTSVATVLCGTGAPTKCGGRRRAALRFGDALFEVADGTTIGAPNHAQGADIALPIGENRHVSGIHGRFERTDQGWVYEQLGPNGSTLVQDRNATKLHPGSREVLQHGAILELPHVEERLVFELRS